MWHLGRRNAGRKNHFRPKKTLKDGELEMAMATRKGEKKEGKKRRGMGFGRRNWRERPSAKSKQTNTEK